MAWSDGASSGLVSIVFRKPSRVDVSFHVEVPSCFISELFMVIGMYVLEWVVGKIFAFFDFFL